MWRKSFEEMCKSKKKKRKRKEKVFCLKFDSFSLFLHGNLNSYLFRFILFFRFPPNSKYCEYNPL